MSTNSERVERLLALRNESKRDADDGARQIVENVDESIALLDDGRSSGEEGLDSYMVAKQKSLDDMDEEELRMACGVRLRHARLSRGMLLRDVVDKMKNVWANTEHVSRLQSYESGQRMMSVTTARHLARVYGVSAAWLLCVDDTIGLADDQLEALRLYVQAPESVRQLVLRMLRGTSV